MIPRSTITIFLAAGVLVTNPLSGQSEPASALAREVFVAESSFAATFARRDIAAFAAFVSPEAVFFGRTVMRGREEVVEGWRGLFQEPNPPFSWKPQLIEVLASGTLALSSGPVFSPDGKHASNFISVWRREADGTWLVVLDRGSPVCNCEPAPAE
jgi:ketosteroid isomerase-like protein